MKRRGLISIFILAQLLVTSVYAYDFSSESNGKTIYYNINEDNASLSVTFKDDKYASYLGDIVIPATVDNGGKTYTVTKVGDSAFRNSILTSIDIQADVVTIGNDAFRGCKRLSKVQLPETLETIGTYSFGASGLDSIAIPEKVKEIPMMAFKGCTNMTKVKLPESLLRINNYSFYDCKRLKTVNFPDSLKVIGKSAFFNCYMLGPKIELKKSLNSVGTYSFGNCYSLKEVYTYAAPYIPFAEKEAFGDVYPDDLVLYVGRGGILPHQKMPGWKEFKTIKEME